MSSSVDRDLEAALRGTDEEPVAVVSGSGPAPAPAARRGSVGLLVGLLVIVGGIVALVMTSFKDAAVYAMSVDQVSAQAGSLGARRLRVEGNLVKGTLQKRDQPCEYRFRMEKNGKQMAVRFPQCVVPDTFRDVPGMDVGVTVEGKLASDGSFDATQVMAKCPSKYEMKDMQKQGQQMPHEATAPAAP